jgi:hypothetical protein
MTPAWHGHIQVSQHFFYFFPLPREQLFRA